MSQIAHQTDFVNVAGKKIQVMRGGSGPTLVYLHSAGGEMDWLPFHNELAKHYSVIAPAHPGFSLSEGLDKIDDMQDLVWHYVDFFQQFDLRGVPVVGFSLGGWLGVELAILRPELVGKLVMVNAAGLHIDGAPMGEIFIDNFEKLRQLVFFDPECPAGKEMKAAMEDEMQLLMYLRAREATARVGWNPYLHNPKLPSHLHRVQAPTLLLWGREDRVIPLAHGEAYAKQIAGAKLEIYDKCGHMLAFEYPERFGRSVVEFVGTA